MWQKPSRPRPGEPGQRSGNTIAGGEGRRLGDQLLGLIKMGGRNNLAAGREATMEREAARGPAGRSVSKRSRIGATVEAGKKRSGPCEHSRRKDEQQTRRGESSKRIHRHAVRATEHCQAELVIHHRQLQDFTRCDILVEQRLS